MKLKVTKLHPDAIIPRYQTAGAACFDLHTCDHEPVIVNSTVILRTGLAFDIPADHVMLVFSRSGHGFKADTRLANCVGVIDSDFTQEVMVKLTRDEAFCEAITVNPGDRVAQAMVIPFQQFELEETLDDILPKGNRTGGLGSTGMK